VSTEVAVRRRRQRRVIGAVMGCVVRRLGRRVGTGRSRSGRSVQEEREYDEDTQAHGTV
jgi:hypothetical protein